MFKEDEANTARQLELDSTEEIRCNDCCCRPVTYMEFVVTMIGTFNGALSILEIWFFDESRMIQGFTSLPHDGKDLSLCTRSQALDLIDYSTRMARKYKTHEILNTYDGFILDQLGPSV
jgi:hypothetical protein